MDTRPAFGSPNPILSHRLSGQEPVRAYQPKGKRTLPYVANPWGLSPMEVGIAQLSAEGLGCTEIGSRLCISPKTAATYLGRVRDKMGVETTLQAALEWDRHSRQPIAGAVPANAPMAMLMTIIAAKWREFSSRASRKIEPEALIRERRAYYAGFEAALAAYIGMAGDVPVEEVDEGSSACHS